MLYALDQVENVINYPAACAEAGIMPVVHPYWEKLPYCNIFIAITPDVSH